MSCTCLLRSLRPTTRLSAVRPATFSTSSLASAPAAAASWGASAKAAPSSCPAGTKITGISVFKDGQDPVAKEDSEYPAWLWQILEPKKGGEDEAGALYNERRRMKKEGRTAIKATNTLKG